MIRLQYESEALVLSIQDNGCGFQYSDRTTTSGGHFGIPVMEERARKLGGTLRVLTSLDSGTEITVKVSFNALQQPVSQEHHVIRWIGI
jgi:signal transduction histidine kinase